MSSKRRHNDDERTSLENDDIAVVPNESNKKRQRSSSTHHQSSSSSNDNNNDNRNIPTPTVTAVLSSSSSSVPNRNTTTTNTSTTNNNSSTTNSSSTQNDVSHTNQSMFWYKTIEVAVAILPSALRSNLLSEIEDGLWPLLFKYSNSIKGVPLCFTNVRFKNDNSNNNNSSNNIINGQIINEMPYIHYSIIADTIVFAPTIGCILEGIITDTFHSHISISVLNYFNASIPSQQLELVGQYRYNTITDEWIDTNNSNNNNNNNQGNRKSSTLSINNSIKFICSQVHASLGTMSIIGSLIPNQQNV